MMDLEGNVSVIALFVKFFVSTDVELEACVRDGCDESLFEDGLVHHATSTHGEDFEQLTEQRKSLMLFRVQSTTQQSELQNIV